MTSLSTGLCHAEGDGLPGLVIDRFGDTLTVQIGTAGMEKQIETLIQSLDIVLKPKTIILRNDAPVARPGRAGLLCEDGEGRRPPHRGGGKWRALYRRSGRRPEDRLVLRPARQPRLHRRPRQGQDGAGRLFLYRRLRHPGGQGGRQGSRVPGFSSAPALAIAEESAARQRRDHPGRQGRCVRGTGTAEGRPARHSISCWPIRRPL